MRLMRRIASAPPRLDAAHLEGRLGRRGPQAEREQLHLLPGHVEGVQLLVAVVEPLDRASRCPRRVEVPVGHRHLHLVELAHVAQVRGAREGDRSAAATPSALKPSMASASISA